MVDHIESTADHVAYVEIFADFFLAKAEVFYGLGVFLEVEVH